MAQPVLQHLLASLLTLALVACSASAVAQEGDDEEPEANAEVVAIAQAAFQGRVLRGSPAWVVVEIENRSEERSIVLEVGGVSARREVQVDLAKGARKRIGVLAPTSNIGDTKVTLRDAEGEKLFVTSARIRPRDRNEPVVAYLGTRPPGLRAPEDRADGIDTFDLPWEEQRKHTARTRIQLLPESWTAYSGIDALYWPAPRFDRLTAPQTEALERWILAGGHLVVAEDDGWSALAAHRLSRWLPATPTGVEVVTDKEEIGRYLGPSVSLGRSIESDEPMKPLPESVPRLMGTPKPGVEPFASYSEQAPFGWTWAVGDGRVSLMRTIVKKTGRAPNYDDWSGWTVGQSRPRLVENYASLASVDEPKLDLHPGALLCLLFLYVLIIGPVDYLILRHFRRQELTLITYPAAIVVFSALAWVGMLLSVDAATFLTRTEYTHWHLGPDALEDRPERALPAAGTKVRFLAAGYFPTSRQRVEVSAPEGFDIDGGGGANAWQNVTNDIVFRGPPLVMEATASAYALVDIRFAQFVQTDNTAPIKIVGTSPPVVHNQLQETLEGCWMRDGEATVTALFNLGPGESQPVELTPIDEDTNNGSLYSIPGAYGTEHAKLTAVSAELDQNLARFGRGEIVCRVSGDTDIPVPGLDPETSVNHRLFRFVF